MVADLLSPNYNLNVTEVRDSDFKNPFPGIFNFNVGILFFSNMKINVCYILYSMYLAIRFVMKSEMIILLRTFYSKICRSD